MEIMEKKRGKCRQKLVGGGGGVKANATPIYNARWRENGVHMFMTKLSLE